MILSFNAVNASEQPLSGIDPVYTATTSSDNTIASIQFTDNGVVIIDKQGNIENINSNNIIDTSIIVLQGNTKITFDSTGQFIKRGVITPKVSPIINRNQTFSNVNANYEQIDCFRNEISQGQSECVDAKKWWCWG